MSIRVENNVKTSEKEKVLLLNAHYMPCKIDEDGPAKVKQYFEPYVTETGNGDLKATFRGRPLEGTTTSLPEGYQAVLAYEVRRPFSAEAERNFEIVGGFKEFTLWNWDKKPTPNEPIVRAMDWLDIAEALHGD